MLAKGFKTQRRKQRGKKMMKISSKERRLSPRIYKQLPLKVAANGYDFATTSKNLSCVGAYCHITKYVPPFTKVHVKIDLQNSPLECKGVIVRTEDETSGGFNIAIFFNGITTTARDKISRYVNQVITQELSASRL